MSSRTALAKPASTLTYSYEVCVLTLRELKGGSGIVQLQTWTWCDDSAWSGQRAR